MKKLSILDEICAKSFEDLQRKIETSPLETILEKAQNAKKRACFKSALKAEGEFPAIIAELKKASPSEGIIRENFEVKKLAVELEKAGAAALSILTEKNYFMGSLDNLSIAFESVKIPLLRKDFIFCEYQICEAVLSGASAILLIKKMLDEEKFVRLFKFAKSLGLDVLAEAHDEFEISSLLENGADIIGVNCRNLKNFHTDFSVAERLLKEIPQSVVRVAESAIADTETLLRARDAGADAALIGTAIMRSSSPSAKLLELLKK